LRIALVHNEYGKVSGEEVAVNHLAALLEEKGHHVIRFSRGSAEIRQKALGQLQACLAGVYNPFSRRAFARMLDSTGPEIVHVHNLYPFISASILPECTKRNVPVVMTLHNFRIVCPNALLMRDGRVCHECLGGREWRCAWHNCEHSLPKSVGYAARTAFARRSGWFRAHVSRFICLTAFQRDIYAREGFPAERMAVIPNPGGLIRDSRFEIRDEDDSRFEIRDSNYVGYVGRVSPEKDVPTLLAAARLLPDIPFKVAGDFWRMRDLVRQAPVNVKFLGHLDAPRLSEFYRDMRLMAFTTLCYEGFPMALVEAMAKGIPIVCARIGGLPEIVEDGHTGLLYEPGNADQLAGCIKQLWDDQKLSERLGEAGRQKARTQYSDESIYKQLMNVYDGIHKHPMHFLDADSRG
jgi:glycosyltransferase involved in cell wall biosynthesis